MERTEATVESRFWVLRSLLAGLAAAVVGVSVGWGQYFALPGAMRIDWAVMTPVVLVFGAGCGVCVGMGLGAGVHLAVRKRRGPFSAARLMSGAVLGALPVCTPMAAAGIVFFGSLHAPYAGTANILGSCLLAATTYVALFAPVVVPARLRLGARLAVAAACAVLSAVSLGLLGWMFASTLSLIPSFDELVTLANDWGMTTFSLVCGAFIAVGMGVYFGLATWLYGAMATALQRRR